MHRVLTSSLFILAACATAETSDTSTGAGAFAATSKGTDMGANAEAAAAAGEFGKLEEDHSTDSAYWDTLNQKADILNEKASTGEIDLQHDCGYTADGLDPNLMWATATYEDTGPCVPNGACHPYNFVCDETYTRCWPDDRAPEWTAKSLPVGLTYSLVDAGKGLYDFKPLACDPTVDVDCGEALCPPHEDNQERLVNDEPPPCNPGVGNGANHTASSTHNIHCGTAAPWPGKHLGWVDQTWDDTFTCPAINIWADVDGDCTFAYFAFTNIYSSTNDCLSTTTMPTVTIGTWTLTSANNGACGGYYVFDDNPANLMPDTQPAFQDGCDQLNWCTQPCGEC